MTTERKKQNLNEDDGGRRWERWREREKERVDTHWKRIENGNWLGEEE